MSRRRVSVRELGPGDRQGWLQRQTGTHRFLGARWRRNWFVLRNNSLYWYPSHTAEKAEGFVDLTGFTIQPIRSHGKQHVIKVSHRDVATVIMAAESFTEMSLWLDELSAAILQTRAPHPSSRECYSQISDQGSEESVFYSCPPCTELPTVDSMNGDFPPPCFTSSPFYNHVFTSHRARRTRRTSSRTSSVSTSRTSSSENSEARSFRRSGSWLDLPTPNTARSAAKQPPFLLSVGGDDDDDEVEDGPPGPNTQPPNESRPDDTGTSSSPIGRTKLSNQRGRMGSLVRLQETLYLVRILNPTLKTEEADLLAIEQVLTDPTRPNLKCCNWSHKFILLQEINHRKGPAGGARDTWIPATTERCVAETSV